MGYVYNANKSRPWRKERWRVVYKNPDGVDVDEKGAPTEAASEQLLKMREHDVAKGCWSPLSAASGAGGMPTFEEYEKRHDATRKAAGKSLALDGTEHGRMKNHVVPHIGKKRMDQIGRDDIEGVIARLMNTPAAERLAPSTILSIYGDLRVLFSRAVHKDKIVAINPCTLKLEFDELPKKQDKDPRWRATAKYSRAELMMLLFDERLPPDRHMVYALEFLGFMRSGEAAGRRWIDWDETQEPLGQLAVVTQYDDKETKTRRPRMTPVHPVLALMLAVFREHWWPILYGRAPKPEDYIVPVRGRGRPRAGVVLRHRKKNTMYTQLQRDLEVLGLRRRRVHDLRRSGISMARSGGADRDALKAVTHGSKGDIIDDYTSWDFRDLCKAVQCIAFELPPGHGSRPALQLAAAHSVEGSRQRGARQGLSRGRYGDSSLARQEKAQVAVGKSEGISMSYAVTPTGIEAEGRGHSGALSAGFSTTPGRPGARAVGKNGGDPESADEALARRASDLDLCDALREGAAALLHTPPEDASVRVRLATLMEQAARRLGDLIPRPEPASEEEAG